MKTARAYAMLLTGAAASSLLVGCATIMHGTNQSIGISSNPSDAAI